MALSVREELNKQLIEMLEAGQPLPWERGWAQGASASLPINALTGNRYRGGNTLNLWVKSIQRNWPDMRFVTMNQASQLKYGTNSRLNDASIAKNAELVKSLGFKKASQHPDYSATWQIREEEWKKYTYVERWGDVDDTKIKDGAPVKGKKLVPFAPARVYNVAQIDGVPPAVKMELEWTPLEIGEKILKDSGARIEHGASIASIWFDATDEYRAFYDRGEDYIQMPGKERFKEPGLYYAVALHELSHWSGHPTRLNRDMTGRFGSAAYAREELRAEISSMYISAEIGIPVYPSRVAAYAQSWLKAIKDDPNAVFQACSDATKMAEYVISLSPELKLRLDEQREMMKPTVEPSVAIAAPALV